MNLPERPRRLRGSAAIREMVAETRVDIADLIQPLFVIEKGGPEPISSMPGQYRFNLRDIVVEARKLHLLGIRAIALFPALGQAFKSEKGEEALHPETLILRAIRAVKAEVPEMLIAADIALDPYTVHGHDGVLTADGSNVDNDETVSVLAKMAVLNAEAGADMLAPSDMMDGRVAAIRSALDEAGYEDRMIMAYSAKFNSAYYGPFRTAVGSAKAAGTTLLGKDTYQLNPANAKEAVKELLLDEEEGADILMVKPAGAYLDIIHLAAEQTQLPVAAYQVSGEYAQIKAAASVGWLDYQRVRDESLLAIRRAGAKIILTYFAGEIATEAGAVEDERSKIEGGDLYPGAGI